MFSITRKNLVRIINFYPPYLGAGIKAKYIDPFTYETRMPLRFYNQNYMHTHFGGSIYSMVDPFFVFILIDNLGRDYVVWDKAASIKFVKPGRSMLKARFHISADQVKGIAKLARSNGIEEPTFEVEIKDADNNLVAIVEKRLWVKYKNFETIEEIKAA